MTQSHARYDRARLLSGALRNATLDLAAVERYGADSWGDPDYVSLYGSRPAEWYARGIRVLGRTAVECTRDVLAQAIGRDVASIAATCDAKAGVTVIDPFAGSANTLYWLHRELDARRAIGFESDPGVFALTHRNLELLQLSIEYVDVDYVAGLDQLSIAVDQLVVVFIAPPWGDALSPEDGLDLQRTTPPVVDIVQHFRRRIPQPTLFAIQIFERLVEKSLDDLRAQFDWSDLRTYGLNRPGANHGVLRATSGWTPPRASLPSA